MEKVHLDKIGKFYFKKQQFLKKIRSSHSLVRFATLGDQPTPNSFRPPTTQKCPSCAPEK